MDSEEKTGFFGDLDQQMQDIKGGDRLTDKERRAIKGGVGKDDEFAMNALARQMRELMAEQNPKGLPLIFKSGYVIKVKRSSGNIDTDWRVKQFDKSGFVIVDKPNPEVHKKRMERTLYFKEFYELNPPDATCQNAEYLEEYSKK
ncbi:MAG: hypothetical protein P4L74_06485 [Candidatus Doudnabacteria bacterium]|nr:hypothetical protein [Candidatus Doudnabacteria bacterium]